MKNDFDFIKEKFDNDNISAPLELDKKIMDGISESKPEKVKVIKTNAFRRIVSVAACLAIIFTAISVIGDYKYNSTDLSSSDYSTVNTFDNYGQIKEYLKESENNIVDSGCIRYYDNATTKDVSKKEFSYSDTYTQVENIDEADRIKTYENYIFFSCVKVNKSFVNIYRVDNGNSELMSKITFKYKDKDNICKRIRDIYVKENRLIVNFYGYYSRKNTDSYYDADEVTETLVYDITDIKNPQQIYSFTQSGYYTSSRMIGDKLYIISDFNPIVDKEENIMRYVPSCYENDGEKETLSLKDICYMENKKGNMANYIVVSAIDVMTGEKSGDTKAVLASAADVYCSFENLYVIGNTYNINEIDFIDTFTNIVKISLEDNLEFVAENKIKGYYDDQYAFDEKDGKLRVCLTKTKKEKEINKLYVLDEKLEIISETKAFAPNETIRAVKYIGDYAYVITYRETDPLFVIDLSDYNNPTIKGEVKITGFSTMLVDAGNDMLLGIGYNDNMSGVKLALFDVSNPEKPTVVDNKEIERIYSAVQYEPKALVVNKDKGYYAIPYNGLYNRKGGVITFGIKDNKINVTNITETNVKDTDIERVTYVDDYIYALDWNSDIYSYHIK